MKADLDRRRFLACEIKYMGLLDQDNNPEYWRLWTTNLPVLEKMMEVKPLEDRDCPTFKRRNAQQFDVKEWWLKHEVFG